MTCGGKNFTLNNGQLFYFFFFRKVHISPFARASHGRLTAPHLQRAQKIRRFVFFQARIVSSMNNFSSKFSLSSGFNEFRSRLRRILYCISSIVPPRNSI